MRKILPYLSKLKYNLDMKKLEHKEMDLIDTCKYFIYYQTIINYYIIENLLLLS